MRPPALDSGATRLACATLAAAVVAALMAVPASADAPSPVLGLRLAGSTAIDVLRLNVSYPATAPADALPFRCSSEGTLSLQPAYRSFTFREEASEGGCAEARADVRIPTGVRSFTVAFRANREIVTAIDYPGRPPEDMYQSVRVWDGNGTLLRDEDYFTAYAPTQAAFQAFEILVQVPLNETRMQVGWYFYDNAALVDQDQAPAPGDSFRATVREPRIVFDPVELDPGIASYAEAGTSEQDGLLHRHGRLSLVLRPAQLVANESLLVLELPASQEVDAIVLDDGIKVAGSEFRQSTKGLGRTVELGPLSPSDWGAYSFHLRESVPLPPAAPPPPPARIDPLAATALLAPLPFAVGAVVQAHRYRMRAEPSQRVPVVSLAVLVGLAGAAYLLVLGAVAWRDAFDAMATLPVVSEGWRAYVALGAVVAVFLILTAVATVEHRRAKDLRHARELQRSNKELEAFASAASHDLQEPLRDVQNTLLLLDEQYGRRVPKDGRALLRDAERGAERMRDLVRGVLAFAKAGEADFQPVRLDGVVASARALVRASLAEAGVRLRVDPLPHVHGDAGALVRLFENLLTNAVKFHGKQDPRIHVRALRERTMWRIEVADNGVGIPVADRERVFRLFERLHGPEVPGAGLGLALCARIVERHGGTIGITDTPGGGTTVYFTLPAAKAR